MRSRFWTIIGVLLTVAMIILSAFINYTFGYSLGTTETNARIFGAVSVVAVEVMALLPLRISAHWGEGRKARAVLGVCVFGILVIYAIAGSIGFGMQNRSQLAGSRENLAAQLDDAIRERDEALVRSKGLPDHRPSATVMAAIDSAKKDRRWQATEGCTNATAAPSREFCQGIDRLLGELGTAASAAVLGEKIERLNFSIATLRKQGAGEIADPQSFGFAIVLGLEQNQVRVGLSILLALVVESICCFGLLVIMSGDGGGGAAERAPAKPTVAEWIGKWLTDRAEPDPTFSDLEADFREWGRGRGMARLGSRKFRRLLRAAYAEVGLMVVGRTAVGLRICPQSTT